MFCDATRIAVHQTCTMEGRPLLWKDETWARPLGLSSKSWQNCRILQTCAFSEFCKWGIHHLTPVYILRKYICIYISVSLYICIYILVSFVSMKYVLSIENQSSAIFGCLLAISQCAVNNIKVLIGRPYFSFPFGAVFSCTVSVMLTSSFLYCVSTDHDHQGLREDLIFWPDLSLVGNLFQKMHSNAHPTWQIAAVGSRRSDGRSPQVTCGDPGDLQWPLD